VAWLEHERAWYCQCRPAVQPSRRVGIGTQAMMHRHGEGCDARDDAVTPMMRPVRMGALLA